MKTIFCNIVTIIALLLLGCVEVSAQDCYQPYPLEEVFGTPSVDNITTNSATLHWYDPNLEMDPTAQLHWIVLYSTSNLTNPNPANGTQVNCNATDPMDVNCNLTGLQPGTAYNCYIWTSCSSTSISEEYATISFRTACATISAPYSEDFEGYTSPATILTHYYSIVSKKYVIHYFRGYLYQNVKKCEFVTSTLCDTKSSIDIHSLFCSTQSRIRCPISELPKMSSHTPRQTVSSVSY